MDKSVNNNDIFKSIKESMGLKEINIVDYSPLTLAYIGDGIYEIVIRTMIVDETKFIKQLQI